MIKVYTSDGKPTEIDPESMPITAVIAEFLALKGWDDDITLNEEKNRAQVQYSTTINGVSFANIIESWEHHERIFVYGYTKFEVPPSRMGELSRLMNIINMSNNFGRLACNDDDDANPIQFCIGYDVEGSSVTAKQIDIMTKEAGLWFSRWHSTLASVALTKTTAKKALEQFLADQAAAEEERSDDEDAPREL
jgi:Putative bacterial sensory transduction regulator